MRKKVSNLLALTLCLSGLALPACNSSIGTNTGNKLVLRVGSWDEYIDTGGEESYVEGSKALYDEFVDDYNARTGKNIEIEYVPLQDNETMYNKLKMGDSYDLLCPSEYMIMKLISENQLQAFPSSFLDPSIEGNYYAQNLSPYIKKEFEKGGWSNYVAGYMWGSTGFVYNPDVFAPNNPEKAREIMSDWSVLTASESKRLITAKDNVRDTYFMGLGVYHQQALLQEKTRLDNGEITLDEYQTTLREKMNDTSDATINGVRKVLENVRGNLYGLETDEGKLDIIAGRLGASYQWSGDAVFTLDEAEDDKEGTRNPLYLEYAIPASASNLWFDGWVLTKNVSPEKVELATAFINFLSKPINVVRNMYYIGYTSCLSGDPNAEENLIYDYISETYSADEEETDTAEYNLDYFFGDGHTLTVPADQLHRQLFAQYPDNETIKRLVVMQNFTPEKNKKLNRMWTSIK